MTETRSRKLWRAWLSYHGPWKKELISSMWALEQSGALAEIGEPGSQAERVRHKEIAAILGNLQRETVTKRLGHFNSFGKPCMRCIAADGGHRWPCPCQCHGVHPDWREDATCKCHGRPRRECHREKTMAGRQKSAVDSSPSTDCPLSSVARRETDHCDRDKDGVRVRQHVAAILARNPGWRVANSYALACDDGLRPAISAGANQVGFLAHTFGADLFSRKKQDWLEDWQSLEGFRRSRGWHFDPNLPWAPDCVCRRGQLKLGFQEICPKCEGRGFVIEGSMPDYARQVLHWMDDRGMDVELRRCPKHKKIFEAAQCCTECGSRGDLHKKRGELNGAGSAKYSMEQIAAANGLDVSTLYRYFTGYKRLGLVRTAPGTKYRKCENARCSKLPLYVDKCPGCGGANGAIKKSDPQLIIDLTSRTLDRDMARAERARMDRLVKWHRRWLDQKHQAELEAAVAMVKKVLGEWEGNEHLLQSFYNEMRRRLAASNSRANLVNVLFPLQLE